MSDRGVQIALSEGLEVLSAAWTDGSLGKCLATTGERSTDSLRLSNASDIFRVRHFLDRTDCTPGVFRAGLLAFQFFFHIVWFAIPCLPRAPMIAELYTV